MTTRVHDVQVGWDVIGADDQKIGEVTDLGDNYVLLTKGLIFPKDIFVPFEAIKDVDAGRGCVYVNASKDEIESMGWDQEPESWGSGASERGADSASFVDDTSSTQSSTSGFSNGNGTTTDEDSVRVPVREEQLRASTRTDEVGAVEVNKRVTEQEQQLDVPVTREEVDVRRVRVDRPADDLDATTMDDGTIRVPVRAETVEVVKEPRVVEELEISKRPVTETKRVSDTVRREEVDVDDSGAVYPEDRSR
jgi:uncharacterized protein (TIGR02271 family)